VISKLIAAVVAVPLVLAAAQRSAAPPPASIQLLAFNDFHGHLEPPTGANGRVQETAAGGAEFLASHLARAIAEQPNSLVVAAGDLVGASPLVSGLFHDEPTIESMNAMQLSVSSVGNHEFDKGQRELRRLQAGGCHPVDGCREGDRFAGARFQYLSANVVDSKTRQPIFPATIVRTVDGVRIGFIGETLKGTPRIVAPAAIEGLSFLDEATTANAYARQLERQGVHTIVLLIHQGGRQGSTAATEDPNACTDFAGAIVPIVRKLHSSIRVIVSGHTHRFYNCTIAGRLVTSAGSFGRGISRIRLSIGRSTGRIAAMSATNEVVDRMVTKDPVQTALVAKYAALAAPLANRVVGSVTGSLTRGLSHAGESSLGEVLADAQLAYVRSAQTTGADVSFMNSGGLRADVAVPDTAALQPADVTYRQLYEVQPFGNVVVTITMTGEMIKRLLEQQFTAAGTDILQVSAGFTYRYRLNAPASSHIDPASIAIEGRRIAPGDRVRVVASDFLVTGGGGFTVFGEGTNNTGGDLDINALVAYFRNHSPISPGPMNRIIRTD
jgi:5'-nucleotidase